MIGKKDARAGRERRRKRVRGKIHGTSERLRLCVFRSSAHIYAQIIDDDRGHTLVAASTLDKDVSGVPAGLPVSVISSASGSAHASAGHGSSASACVQARAKATRGKRYLERM